MADIDVKKICIAGLCAAVIIIIIVQTSHGKKIKAFNEDFIYGHWVADDAFCTRAEISSMMLFIGEPEKYKGGKKSRPSHLIINNDITNQPLTIIYKPGSISSLNDTYKLDVDIEFEEPIDIPPRVNMDFNIAAGRLRIYRDDELYGVLYKDNEVTDLFKSRDDS